MVLPTHGVDLRVSTCRHGGHLRQLLALRMEFGSTVHEDFGRRFDPELTAHLIDGLRNAGLEM